MAKQDGFADSPLTPHYAGHRDRLRERFRRGGGEALADYELLPEAWGGDTRYSEVSALKKTGISGLLETILLEAEFLELKTNYNCRALGKIVESKVDPFINCP